jgi:hypothetical protein
MSAVRHSRLLSDAPGDGQRFAIALTTLMAGAIGAYYANFYWDYPAVPTIPLHMDPAHRQVVNWAPRWVPVSIMALLSMLFWRLLVARARGISMRAAVITFFVLFALRHGTEFVCLEYSAALQYPEPPPLWKMAAMFPLVLLGGLFTTGAMLLLGFPGDWIAMLVLACAAGVPTAAIGRLLWKWLE